MNDVKPWPNVAGRPVEPPKRIVRPADYGLWLAVLNLETQLGTIEAYNRIVTAAEVLRRQIDDGKAKPQNPIYAVSVDGSQSAALGSHNSKGENDVR